MFFLLMIGLFTGTVLSEIAEVDKEKICNPKGAPILTFIQITDSHITPTGIHKMGRQKVAENLRKCVEEINSMKVDFVIHTGDLVEEGLPEEYKSFMGIMSGLKIKWYALAGNHETLKGTWEDFKKFTSQPLYQSFEYKGCQFILLNGSKNEKKYYGAGFIDDEQLKWLEDQLEKGKDKLYTFVFCHFPLEKKWDGVGIKSPEREKILGLLKKYKVAAFILGHRHKHDYSFTDGTTHILCAAIGWNFLALPVGYRIYKVYPEVTISEWKDLGGNIWKYRMTIPNPRKVDFAKIKIKKKKVKMKIEKEEGLVGYFKFDEEGDEVMDSSGNGNNGKFCGADWCGVKRVKGKFGKALFLDGMDDYVNFGNVFNMGKSDFTISFWFKKGDPEDKSVSLLFKGKEKKRGPGYGFLLRETGGQLKFTISDGKDIIQTVGPPIFDNKWHHVVGVRGGGKVKLYLDGKLVSEVEDTIGSVDNNENFIIGKMGYGNNPGGPYAMRFFNGYIDEFRIYRKSVSEEEI